MKNLNKKVKGLKQINDEIDSLTNYLEKILNIDFEKVLPQVDKLLDFYNNLKLEKVNI